MDISYGGLSNIIDAENEGISIYVHIPFCVRKCLYCDFLSAPADDETRENYVKSLINEIRSYRNIYGRRSVRSVFIGGGTTSVLSEDQFGRVMEALIDSFSGIAGNSIGDTAMNDVKDSSGSNVSMTDDSYMDRREKRRRSGADTEREKESKTEKQTDSHIKRAVKGETEITIEINPGTVTRKYCALLCKLGVNRVSIGLQSADNDELMRIGRIHTYEEFLETYRWLREAGCKNINVDIMSALPGQTLSGYLEGLHKILKLKPEHISAYSLILEEGTPLYEMYRDDAVSYNKMNSGSFAGPDDFEINDNISVLNPFVENENGCEINSQIRGDSTEKIHSAENGRVAGLSGGERPAPLPGEDEERRMYEETGVLLAEHGYKRYEISNYAREGFECEHNKVYWQRKDYLGIGLGASSCVGNVRWKNRDDLSGYIKLLSDAGSDHTDYDAAKLQVEKQVLTINEQMEETMFLGLRMMRGVDRNEFRKLYGCDITEVYGSVIDKYQRQGLLVLDNDRICQTDEGINVSNVIFADFLLDK